MTVAQFHRRKSPLPHGLSSAQLDVIDALESEATCARGIADAFLGVASITDTETEMQGALALMEAHIDRLKELSAKVDAALRPERTT
jgi:hypothetical protein